VPADPKNWRDDAACEKARFENPLLDVAWIDEESQFKKEATKICLSCKVRLVCLQDALDDPEAQGIRGGYEFDGGKLPVAQAREIRDTLDLRIGSHQSTGKGVKK
jgi:hypothetical protein